MGNHHIIVSILQHVTAINHFWGEIKHLFYVYIKKKQKYFSTTIKLKIKSAYNRIILAFLYLCLHYTEGFVFSWFPFEGEINPVKKKKQKRVTVPLLWVARAKAGASAFHGLVCGGLVQNSPFAAPRMAAITRCAGSSVCSSGFAFWFAWCAKREAFDEPAGKAAGLFTAAGGVSSKVIAHIGDVFVRLAEAWLLLSVSSPEQQLWPAL